MNNKNKKYLIGLSSIILLFTSVDLGVSSFIKNKIEKNNEISKIDISSNVSNLSIINSRAGETSINDDPIDVSGNYGSFTPEDKASLNNDSVIINKLLANVSNGPTGVNILSYTVKSFSNIAGTITISNVRLSNYNNASGSPAGQPNNFPVNIEVIGFKRITKPTGIGTSQITWPSSNDKKTAIDITSKDILGLVSGNEGTYVSSAANNSVITKVNIEERKYKEGEIKFSIEVKNGYITTSGDNRYTTSTFAIPGYTLTGLVPTDPPANDEKPIEENSDLPWWIWVAIAGGAALLAIIIIIVIIFILRNKKEAQKLAKQKQVLNKTVASKQKLAIGTSSTTQNNTPKQLTNGSTNNNQQQKPNSNSQLNNGIPKPNNLNKGPNTVLGQSGSGNPTQSKSTPPPPPPPPITVNAPPKSLAPKRVQKK